MTCWRNPAALRFFSLVVAASILGCNTGSEEPSPPPVIVTQPADQFVVPGTAATFTVSATGTGELTYQWSRNGSSLAGARTPSYTTPPTIDSDFGSTFAVVVTDALGVSTSSGIAYLRAQGFIRTGSSPVGREYHTATLLETGRVLVTGGDFTNQPSPIADLYDPANGTFARSGTMGSFRTCHAATELPDGRALVTGGFASGPYVVPNSSVPLLSAELFDAAASAFSPTASLSIGRGCHTATLLRDGRVLIAGGYARIVGMSAAASAPVTSAEIYDPIAGTFTPTGSMGVARAGGTATLLADGKVLVTGGVDVFDASAEVYDPSIGTFSPTGSLPIPLIAQMAAPVRDGKVLLVGSANLDGSQMSAALYDPTTGVFIPTGSPVGGHISGTLTALANGKALLAGGDVASAELYDPKTGSFIDAGAMSSKRIRATATALKDGSVLVLGGEDAMSQLVTVERWSWAP
jgi:hypothetical protein